MDGKFVGEELVENLEGWKLGAGLIVGAVDGVVCWFDGCDGCGKVCECAVNDNSLGCPHGATLA